MLLQGHLVASLIAMWKLMEDDHYRAVLNCYSDKKPLKVCTLFSNWTNLWKHTLPMFSTSYKITNGVRHPRQIRGPKIRASVPPKGLCWRHRVCHLGAISSLGQHVDVLALAGYRRRKSALTAGPICKWLVWGILTCKCVMALDSLCNLPYREICS